MKLKNLLFSKLAIFAIASMTFFSSCQANVNANNQCPLPSQRGAVVMSGLDVLMERDFDILRGKRVGLLSNPTGICLNMRSIVDIMYDAGINVTVLFAPEHGIRGDYWAGDEIPDAVDPHTGFKIYTLHGRDPDGRSRRQPTQGIMQEIDVLVYDIMDIGIRSYTFVSSMGLAMAAAAEAGVKFVVLDRPNPLGGLKVEGGLIPDSAFISFVSQFNVPYIYGLTPGELALLLNSRGMLQGGKQVELEVVPMRGWTRDMLFADTGMQWILPSPQIPNPSSALLCPATGILGEIYPAAIGVGYTLPFEVIAKPWITSADRFADAMNALNLPGLHFRPIHFRTFFDIRRGGSGGEPANTRMQGVQIHITDFHAANLTLVQFYAMQELAKLYPEHRIFDHAPASRFRMFDLVSGTDQVRINFSKNHRVDDIRDFWTRDVDAWKELKRNYWLY